MSSKSLIEKPTKKNGKRFILNVIPFLLITSLLILLIFIIHGLFTKNVTYETVKITVEEGYQIVGTLAYPTKGVNETMPGVIMLHSLLSSKEWMMYWVQSVVMNNMVCLAIDLPGHGESGSEFNDEYLVQESIAAVDYLKNLTMVDRNRIAGIGWSLGGKTLIDMNKERFDILNASVLVGYPLPLGFNYTTSFPRNILFSIGIFDELYGIDEIINDMNLITPYNTTVTKCDGTVYGNFIDGTARSCCNATTDHVYAAVDGNLIQCSMSWLNSVFFQNRQTSYTKGIFWRELLSLSAGTCCLILYALIFFILQLDKENVTRKYHYQSYWWFIHGSVNFICMILGCLFLMVPFYVNYFLVFVGWFVLSSISYAILFAKLHPNYKFKQVALYPWKTTSGVKTVLVLIFFVVYHTALQYLLFQVPWSLNFGYPIFSSLFAGELYFKRYLLFFPMWALTTINSVYEISVLEKIVGSRFSCWNFFYTSLARLWLFFLVLIVTFILTLLQLRINAITFMLLFLLPLNTIYIALTLITQWGRHFNHSSINISIISGGIFATLIATFLNFNS